MNVPLIGGGTRRAKITISLNIPGTMTEPELLNNFLADLRVSIAFAKGVTGVSADLEPDPKLPTDLTASPRP